MRPVRPIAPDYLCTKLPPATTHRDFVANYWKVAESFDRLEKLGCIREFPDETRRQAVAGEYLTALALGHRPLVVAQTWDEVHAVNDAIRGALVDSGKIAPGAT